MAISDEKAGAVRTSHDVSKTSNSLKEKDAENATASYLPQSNEEYVVTFKTWCVVVVSPMFNFANRPALTTSQDPSSFIRYQFLDRSIAQRMRCCGGDSTRRPDQSGVVCVFVYYYGDDSLHGVWRQ
jgi:hypothetical protein